MTDHDNFTALRRYTRQEAAARLNISDSWLKHWVTQRTVPHQRSGKPGPHQRGVWFTYADIQAIGQVLPELMSGRQANSRAESPSAGVAAQPAAAPTEAAEDLIKQFSDLRSLRRRA